MKKFLVDAHCDTITKLKDENKMLLKNDLHISLERLREFDYPVQFFAICLDKKYYNNAFLKTNEYIDFFKNQLDNNSEFINIALSYEDIIKNRDKKKASALLTIEGSEAIEDDYENIFRLYNKGIRLVTLTWNYNNNVASGVKANVDTGITEFGYNAIEIMNKLNMIIDVSHLSEKSFWNLDKIMDRPYIASHSNSFTICNNKRNLTDLQIKAIANKGGVIGINMYKDFLTLKSEATCDDVFYHIDYITRLIGWNNIGFGCDFDGIDSSPNDIKNISDLNLLIYKISKRYGYTNMEKLISTNFMRLIKQTLK